MAGQYYATSQGLTTQERLKPTVMSKPLYNEDDWRSSVSNGTIDVYISALLNSDNIDVDSFNSKYKLIDGDQSTRLSALYNEIGADRKTLKEYERPVFDENGNYTYDENGKQVFEKVLSTEYDYNLKNISLANEVYKDSYNAQMKLKDRQNRSEFSKFLADIGVVLSQGSVSILGGIEQLGGLIFATGGELLQEGKDFLFPVWADESKDKTFAERVNHVFTDLSAMDDVQKEIDKFAYHFSHFYTDEGEMTTAGKYITGVVDTLGKMLPSMLISHAVTVVGTSLTGTSTVVGGSKIGNFLTSQAGTIGQLSFYAGNVFGKTVSDQYDYYSSQGITVSSSEIVANALVKTTLQYGVERGLGALLGGTGLDQMFWGTPSKIGRFRFGSKNLTLKSFGRLGVDMLQEGLEESLQETSDWFVDVAHHFINHDFQKTEWNWQNIWDAFAIACLTSIVGTSGRIVGQGVSRKIDTGSFSLKTGAYKVNKDGELIKNAKGEYEFVTLNPIAAYEYGLDLQSYFDNINNLQETGRKLSKLHNDSNVDSKTLSKADSQFIAAYYQALGSFELLSSIYGEMGKERFTKANEILVKMREAQDNGLLSSELRSQAVKEIIDGIPSLAESSVRKIVEAKLRDAEITKTKKSIKKNDVTDSKDNISNKAKKLIEELESVDEVITSEDGKMPVQIERILIVPENLLDNASHRVIIASIAEQKLADELASGVLSKAKYFNNEVSIITDLYRQWSSDEKASEQDAIYNLIFDTRFFEVVLSLNEKITSSFVLRLNSLVDIVGKKQDLENNLLNKRIQECRQRWITAAYNFYSNNLDKDTSLFTKGLTATERKTFDDEIGKLLKLYNMGISIIKKPNEVSNQLWSFIDRRIDNMNVDTSTKESIKSDVRDKDIVKRQNAMDLINEYYDGAFYTLYNGNVYMPETSIGNCALNDWLRKNNLNLKTVFNSDYFTDEDIAELGENYNLEDVYAHRQLQFEELYPNMSFDVYDNGNIVVTIDGNESGFEFYAKTYNKERSNIITGKSFKIGDKDVERSIVTDIENISSWIKDYLRSSLVKDDVHKMLTIDEIINHYEYLNDSVLEAIENRYGRVDKSTVYRYLQNALTSSTDGKKSLVVKQDHTVAIGDMSVMNKVLLKDIKFPKSGVFGIDKFINKKYLTGVLGEIKVEFTTTRPTQYVDYDYDANSNTLNLVNRIYINTNVYKSVDELSFALCHEFQHAIQTENRLTLGTSDNILKHFTDKDKKAIIETVKELEPKLFQGITKQKDIEHNVNSYIYNASGEYQAMGLGGYGEIGFYPVIVSHNRGKTTIKFRNGKSFTVAMKTNPITALRNILDHSREIVSKFYTKYNFTPSIGVLSAQQYSRLKELASKKSIDLTSDECAEIMYCSMRPNMTFEEFKTSQVMGVELNGVKYALYNTSALERTINNIVDSTENDYKDDKVNFKIFTFMPKDLDLFKYQYGEQSGKIYINDSKLTNRRNIAVPLDKKAETISSIENVSSGEYTGLGQFLSDRTLKVSEQKEKAPAEATTKATSTEAEGKIIDKRPKSQRKKSFKYDSKKYTKSTSPIVYSKNPTRVVSEKDIDVDIKNTGMGFRRPRGGNYIYREFVERRYYVDSNGDTQYEDIFNYYTPRKEGSEGRRHTLSSEIKNSNLEYFTTKKGKRQLHSSPQFRDFVDASTGIKLDPKIQCKIESGTLKSVDLVDYIVLNDAENIDNTTFHLICKYYFKNDRFKSPQEFDSIVNELGPKAMALNLVLKDTDLAPLLNKNITFENINRIYEVISSNKEFGEKLSKELSKIEEGYMYRGSMKRSNKSTEGVDTELYFKIVKDRLLDTYDGTIESVGREMSISRQRVLKATDPNPDRRWQTRFTYSVKTSSLENTAARGKDGDELSVEDMQGEVDDFFESVTMTDYDVILRELSDVSLGIGKKVFYEIAKNVLNSEVDNKPLITQRAFANYKANIEKLSEEQVRALYDGLLNDLDDNTIAKIYYLAQISDNNESFLTDNEYTRKNKFKEKAERVADAGSKVQGIKRQVQTIKRYVSKPSEIRLLLKENSDIFDDKLNIKESSFKSENGYKPYPEILELKERIGKISLEARNGVYESDSNYKYYKKSEVKRQKTLDEILKYANKSSKNIKFTMASIQTDEGPIKIKLKEEREIPSSIREVLAVGLTKTGTSKIQELSEYHERFNEDGSTDKVYDDRYLKLAMLPLLRENADLLNGLSEDEAIEILKFYVSDNIIIADVDSQIVSETVRLVSAYILGECRHSEYRQGFDRFNIDESLIKRVEAKMMEQTHMSAAMLSNQRTIIKLLQPEKVIAQQLAKNLGFVLDEEDEANLDNMLTQMRVGTKESYRKAKEKFARKLISEYDDKSKQGKIDKFLTFERAMMLSNPGTWVRNIASNYIVEGGNVASVKTGEFTANLFMKVFPKNKGKLDVDGQYKLGKKVSLESTKEKVGYTNRKGETKSKTKNIYRIKGGDISNETADYINNKFINSGLLEEIIDGVSKYDDLGVRSSSSDDLIDMVARSIHSHIRKNQIFSESKHPMAGAFGNDVIKLIYKGLNDDPWIKRQTIKYFAQIVEEDYKVARTNANNKGKSLSYSEYLKDDKGNIYGVSKPIASAFVKAVNLASYDYMKSPNFISQIERTLRSNVPKSAWLVYKQVFPFLVSSWNWCVEGMRYTPAGLAVSITKLAKLENTISKMDKSHLEGKSIVGSEFAKYLQMRNVGKGVIGTLGFVLGGLLFGLGWAGLDEEDDEYKLIIGDVKVNISDVLGSQGIILGIATVQNATSGGQNIIDVISEVFNQLFRDSIFQDFIDTMRYSDGVGDFALNELGQIPLQIWPNILKAISSIVHYRGVEYSNKPLERYLQKSVLNMLPLPESAVGANVKVDPYTGKAESWLSDELFEKLISKVSPIKVSTPHVSKNEAIAISLDIKKGSLTGRYNVNDNEVVLTSNEISKLNVLYGKLNKDSLSRFYNNSMKVRVKMADGSFKELTYSQMTKEQKRAATDNLMSNNSSIAKIYILTSTGRYRYYTTDSEYDKLRKLGITKNIYKNTKDKSGFVKIN